MPCRCIMSISKVHRAGWNEISFTTSADVSFSRSMYVPFVL
uniref:Uncharacterized protein n=1 Tax=Anopheles christyi TaxID=43041 RepID=A0A182KIR9_9DIPT